VTYCPTPSLTNSLTLSTICPEIRVYRPRNPHLQSPPGIFPQTSTLHKRHREPSNPDPDTDHDPENRPLKRTGAEPSHQTNGYRSRRARGLTDALLRMNRVEAELVTEQLREGLADGVRGRDAVGREVRGDGSLVSE
jgi:hypothetical protein